MDVGSFVRYADNTSKRKTGIMVVDRHNNNEYTEGIKRKSTIAENVVVKLIKIWKNHEITVDTTIRLVPTKPFC